jgi:Cu/Ag efflux protein CusF
MKLIASVLLSLAMLTGTVASAQATTHDSTAQLTEGEVRKVDKVAQKLTIRHGPIVHLEMPAMTMVFQVKDPAMLDNVKTGDKVKFSVEKAGGTFTVTHVETVK